MKSPACGGAFFIDPRKALPARPGFFAFRGITKLVLNTRHLICFHPHCSLCSLGIGGFADGRNLERLADIRTRQYSGGAQDRGARGSYKFSPPPREGSVSSQV